MNKFNIVNKFIGLRAYLGTEIYEKLFKWIKVNGCEGIISDIKS